MNKLLFAIFISLLFTNISFAKLSDTAWNQVYEGCYNSSDKSKFYEQYCTCFVNSFSEMFSDNELNNYLKTTRDVTQDSLFLRVTQQCYDKYK